MDEEAIGVISRNRFTELLQSPLRSGMGCNIDMNEPTARMLDDNKSLHGKEITLLCSTTLLLYTSPTCRPA